MRLSRFYNVYGIVKGFLTILRMNGQNRSRNSNWQMDIWGDQFEIRDWNLFEFVKSMTITTSHLTRFCFSGFRETGTSFIQYLWLLPALLTPRLPSTSPAQGQGFISLPAAWFLYNYHCSNYSLSWLLAGSLLASWSTAPLFVCSLSPLFLILLSCSPLPLSPLMAQFIWTFADASDYSLNSYL